MYAVITAFQSVTDIQTYTYIHTYIYTVLQSKRAKLLILGCFVSNSMYIQYECSVKTCMCRVSTCGASCSGRGSAVSPVRRCGQFFAAGKQKTLGIGLDELLLVKSSDSGRS